MHALLLLVLLHQTPAPAPARPTNPVTIIITNPPPVSPWPGAGHQTPPLFPRCHHHPHRHHCHHR